MGDNWNEHTINFSPAESLHKNEISIRVLDEDLTEEERIPKMKERADLLDGATTLEQITKRQELTAHVKSDPCYKFLMQVSAFSARRISKITSTSGNGIARTPHLEKSLSGDICSKDTTVHDWLQIPEISGVLHLSADAYGHMKEAQNIANHYANRNIRLKDYIEKAAYQTLFARLVAIRMILSSTLAKSDYHKDKTYLRLHREQSMVLNALRRIKRNSFRRVWTEPA